MSGTPGTAIERAKQQAIARPSIPSDDEIRRVWRLAEGLAKSGIWTDKDQTGVAFATILVGHDLGLSPTQALMGVHIVKGRPMVGATTLAGFVKRMPGYDYKVREHDETKCSIDFLIDGRKVGNSTFTLAEATQQKLVKRTSSGEPGMWEKVPRNMLFARALSNGVKWFMPDATGGVPVYHEGELEHRAPELTSGAGSGEAQGLDLGPKVEAVLARAATLGHPALADRGTAEMILGVQSPERAIEWAKAAEVELDDFEREHAAEPPEAEVVSDPIAGDPQAHAAQKREAAAALDAEAEAEGDEAKAEQMRGAADELRSQADALEGGGEDE